jgi:peptidoglycan/xylan/chitin deacetylase (PgdA/CDA1 family)
MPKVRDLIFKYGAGQGASGPVALLSDAFPDADGTELQADAAAIWTAELGKLDIAGGKARGKTVAVDGNELVVNREFTTDTTGWTSSLSGVLTRRDFTTSPDIDPTGGADDFGLEVAYGGSTNGAARQTLIGIPGVKYLGSAQCYSPSANTASNAATVRIDSTGKQTSAEDTWEALSVEAVAANSAPVFYLRCTSGSGGDLAYFDAASCQAEYAIATCDPAQANVDIRVKMTTPASGVIPGGVVVRYKDAANYWLWRVRPGTAGTDFELVEVNAGVQAVRATADIDWAVSTEYALRFTQQGNIYTAYVGGVQKLTYTDVGNFNVNETKCGLLAAGVSLLWDDWTVYPMAAGGVVPQSEWTIPQYGLTDPGTLLEDFATVGDWTLSGGAVEANTTEFRVGAASLKQTTPVGGTSTLTKNISQTFGTAPRIRFSLYMHSFDPEKFSSLQVRFSSTSDFSKFKSASSAVWNYHYHDGWVTLDFEPDDWTDNGGEDWANEMIRLRVLLTSKVGQICSVSWDSLTINPVEQPMVVFTVDDKYLSVYTEMFKFMQSRGVLGTFYVNSASVDGVNDPPYVTSAQLVEMHNAGWDIANHTTDHTDLSTVDLATGTAKLADCKTALDAIVTNSEAEHCSYPSGGYNATARAAAIAAGMLTARRTEPGTAGHPVICSPDQNYEIPSTVTLNSGATLAAVKGYVDEAIAKGRIIVIYAHQVSPTVQDAVTWLRSDFQALIDYCVLNNVPVVRMTDFYALQSGPVTITRTPAP